jgi:hypothetical protein
MTRTRRRVAVAIAVVAFLAVSAIVARWLQADNAERAKVERLLEAQLRSEGPPGKLEIVRYDSATAHALTSKTGPTRVVWRAGDGLPTVQCVEVRRTGNALTGMDVTLTDLSAPIEREASC